MDSKNSGLQENAGSSAEDTQNQPEEVEIVEIGQPPDENDVHFREQFDPLVAESLMLEENNLMDAITENESRKTDSHSSGRSSSCASSDNDSPNSGFVHEK